MHPLDVLENLLAYRGPAGVHQALHAEATRASLCATVELSAIRWSWWRAHGDDLLHVLPSDLGASGHLALLPKELDRATGLVQEQVPAGNGSGGEVHEIPPSPSDWRPGQPFLLFQERFKTALVRGGLASRFAAALACALHEMASNAAEHAISDLPPVASYEIASTGWSFSVTDVGGGIIDSLRRNPAYSGLPDDVSAVRLALRDGVSVTGQKGRGYGFTSVFRALVNRMCTIRLRSTGAVGNWEGQSPGATSLRLMVAPRRPGFHVCVSGVFV
ncbi:hypothetical protein [Polyangium sp. 15x6]|uniref:hypothetical protein n=1 Tax=Polyangium sp. 15x6 TaxID=3042687 RepID=UPI00249B2C90|nr:hypothetical protein [Polyangium sp. 15x6]MDI3290721.1 hypothetical protein [Polyangium sp. 15x6]